MTPPGRIRLKEVLRLTGMARSTFYSRYRWDSSWAARVQMTLDATGRLQFSEYEVRQFAVEYVGDLAVERSGRPVHLFRFCDACGAHLGPRSRYCGQCGDPVAEVE